MFADTGSSTELDTTRWIPKFCEVLEALDSANPDGVQMLLQWNSTEKEVSYVGSLSLITNAGVRPRLIFVSFYHSNIVASIH